MIVWYVLFRIGIAVIVTLFAIGPSGTAEHDENNPGILDWVAELVSPAASNGTSDQDEVIDNPIPEETPGEEPVVTPPPSGIVGEGVSAGPDGTTPSPVSTRQPSSPTPAPAGTPSATPTGTATPTTTPVVISGLRYDEPVLRWLPEMRVASRTHGVSVALLAGVARVASGGEPGLIRADGRRGLLGLTEQELGDLGVTGSDWLDPARHLDAGAEHLAKLRKEEGSWRRALIAYAGTTCNELGQCPEDTVTAILAWRDYYSHALRDPESAGLHRLPSPWQPPEIREIHEDGPHPLVYPPGFGTPTPAASPAPEITPTAPDASPEATPAPEDTATPTQEPGGEGEGTPSPTEESGSPGDGTPAAAASPDSTHAPAEAATPAEPPSATPGTPPVATPAATAAVEDELGSTPQR